MLTKKNRGMMTLMILLAASFGKNKIEYLDASAVDVFKDTHAVIFLINPLAAQSLAYVKEKLKEVPMNVSILLVLNFK